MQTSANAAAASGAGTRKAARRRAGAPIGQETETRRGTGADRAVVRGVADADGAAGAGIDAVPDVCDCLPAGQGQPHGPAAERGGTVVRHGDLALETATPTAHQAVRRGAGAGLPGD